MPIPISTSCEDLSNSPTSGVLSDAHLMAAIKREDKDAFSELYDRYAGTIYGVSLRIMKHQAEAEAVVSDVFWELWRKPAGFDPSRGTCRTYLFTLTRSRAIDRLRATTTRTQITQAAMGEDYRQQASNEPCEGMEAEETCKVVRQALQRLDQVQREALLLAYFDGLTHKEIALHLDKPLGTIKTHIRRGLQTLKTTLKSFGGYDGLQ